MRQGDTGRIAGGDDYGSKLLDILYPPPVGRGNPVNYYSSVNYDII